MNDTLSVLNLRRPTPHPELSYWSVCRVEALFERPFLDLVFEAASVHRQHFDAQRIQLSTLLSVKTGGCPEDCAYCPQSARYDTGVKAQKLLDVETVLASARVDPPSPRPWSMVRPTLWQAGRPSPSCWIGW